MANKILTEEEVNNVGKQYVQGSSSYVSNRLCTGGRAGVLNCDVTSPPNCASNQLVTGVTKKGFSGLIWFSTLNPRRVSWSFDYNGTHHSGTIAVNGWLQDVSTPEGSSTGESRRSTGVRVSTTSNKVQVTNLKINGENKGTVTAWYSIEYGTFDILI